MSVACGIVGLPQSGKTTIFNALTAAGAQTHAYGAASQDPNVAVVPVPDPRLDDLGRAFNTRKIVPATLKFVDVAGLVRGASQGQGIGNQFLAHIREVDCIVQVVRCFENPEVPHVEGSVSAVRDAETIGLELALADLGSVEKRKDKAARTARTGDEEAKKVVTALDKVLPALENGEPARKAELRPEEWALLSDLNLLTAKPMIYVANVDETGLDPAHPQAAALEELAAKENVAVFRIVGSIEAEMAELSEEEKPEFMEAYGLKESGLGKLIKTAFSTLDLMTFLTAGEKETRAWTITRGSRAPQAAGKIHSDMERGFIRMEIFSYDDWVQCGRDVKKVKEKGLYRREGKDYVMQEGDVCEVLFNV